MHRTDKNSQHSSIIWPVWLNGRVFIYELSGCGFEPHCCHSDLYDFCQLQQKNHFLFLTSLYCQIDGVAMGSPLGPILGNAFLCHYEKEWFDSCSVESKPKLYKS